jgi:hypothetical protein
VITVVVMIKYIRHIHQSSRKTLCDNIRKCVRGHGFKQLVKDNDIKSKSTVREWVEAHDGTLESLKSKVHPNRQGKLPKAGDELHQGAKAREGCLMCKVVQSVDMVMIIHLVRRRHHVYKWLKAYPIIIVSHHIAMHYSSYG